MRDSDHTCANNVINETQRLLCGMYDTNLCNSSELALFFYEKFGQEVS